MRNVKIGIFQAEIPAKECSIKEMQDILYGLAEKCLRDGADIVLFPEAFQYIFDRSVKNDEKRHSEISSEWQSRCALLAKTYGAYVVPWDYYFENGCCYNTSYILDRNGDFVGRYKKCNLTKSELDGGLTNGNEYPVFDLDFGKVGIMICFDNYFPESAASLSNKGAELILYPLYGDTLSPQWEIKCRARAIDSSAYLVSCQNDRFFNLAYTGVFDNRGNVVAKLTEPMQTDIVEVDLDDRFITHLSGVIDPPYYEDLKKYLHKCRNHTAFESLAQKGFENGEWNEIFINDKKRG